MSSVSSWAAPCLRLVRDTEDRLRGLKTCTTHFLSRRFPRIESAVALQPTDARTKASIAIRCRRASAPPFCPDPCSDLCSTRARFTLADQMTFCACVHQALIDGYHSLHVCLTHWKKEWADVSPCPGTACHYFVSFPRVVLQPAGRDLHHIAKVWRGAKPKYKTFYSRSGHCAGEGVQCECAAYWVREGWEREKGKTFHDMWLICYIRYLLIHPSLVLSSHLSFTDFSMNTDVLAFYWYICYFNINYLTFARCPGRLHEMRE